jgi:uncharacterized membrane protein
VTRRFVSPRKVRSPSGKSSGDLTFWFVRQIVGSHSNEGDNCIVLVVVINTLFWNCMFPWYIYLPNYVSTETLTNEWMIPSGTTCTSTDIILTSNYPGKLLLWDRNNEVRLYVCSLLFCVSMVSCLGWLTWMGMVFNVAFNNISVISVLLAEKTAVPGENHPPVTNHWQTLSYNVESSTPRHERDSKW